MWQSLTSTFVEDSGGFTVLDLMESRKMTDQIDCQAQKKQSWHRLTGKATITCDFCLRRSLKSWGAWDTESTIPRHRKEMFDNLPSKDKKEGIVNQTNIETVSNTTPQEHLGQDRTHIGFPEHADTILNQQNWAYCVTKAIQILLASSSQNGHATTT